MSFAAPVADFRVGGGGGLCIDRCITHGTATYTDSIDLICLVNGELSLTEPC